MVGEEEGEKGGGEERVEDEGCVGVRGRGSALGRSLRGWGMNCWNTEDIIGI